MTSFGGRNDDFLGRNDDLRSRSSADVARGSYVAHRISVSSRAKRWIPRDYNRQSWDAKAPFFSTSTNATGSMPREAGCNDIAPWASAPRKGQHIIARGKRNAVERHPGLRCVALSGRNHAAYIETINHD